MCDVKYFAKRMRSNKNQPTPEWKHNNNFNVQCIEFLAGENENPKRQQKNNTKKK